MKKLSLAISSVGVVLILGLLMFISTSTTNRVETDVSSKNLTINQEIIWNIKAITPEGRTLDVKAFDKKGNKFAIKAIQDSDQRHLLDIKALVGDKKLPVKILVSEDEYAPVKAIGEDGTIYKIKAITTEGDHLDVKGVGRSGNIIHIKAINKAGEFYGVKAISPEGKLSDVKGVKMKKDNLEAMVNGVEVHAHVKAIPSPGCVGENGLWNIKAFNTKGKTIDVKALDKEGNIYNVKAVQDADQRHILDIKAFIKGKTVPVKILASNVEYAPVKAIGEDGTIYDIKAITADGVKLDVKGVGRSGSIIHIKAINKKGGFYGVKAISPEGQMNDVKGVTMFKNRLEFLVNGVIVGAHVKALPQVN